MASQLTVNPDANPESTSVDGFINRMSAAGETLASLRATGAGETFGPSAAFGSIILVAHGSSTGDYVEMGAAYLLFDISALPANAVITDVSLRLTPTSPPTADWDGEVYVVGAYPAVDTNIAAGDYDTSQFGATDLKASSVTVSDFTVSVQETIALNAAGIAFVQTAVGGTGIVGLGVGMASFLYGTQHGAWVADYVDEVEIGFADNATSANRPALIIDYATSEVVDETLNLVETNLGTPALYEIVDQALNLVESIVAPVAVQAIIDEALNMVEALTALPTIWEVVDETLNMVEDVVTALNFVVRRIIRTSIRGLRGIQTFIRRD